MKLRHYLLDFVVAISFLWVPHLCKAWGFNAHIVINREAVKLLPGELGIYFLHNITYISRHSIDPDLWRQDPEKYPHEARGHYIDADLYDDYPFENIPRSWEALLSAFGEENIEQWGTAPWRINDFFQRLTQDFIEGRWEEARLTAAALGHYVADLHMPLHVVENYNGQLSGNKGIHMRWELDMVDFFLLRSVYPPEELIQIADPLSFAFDIVTESYPHHRKILKSDSLARKMLSFNDREKIANRNELILGTGYEEILFRESGDLARNQMELASNRIASYWYSAWIKAGRPAPILQK